MNIRDRSKGLENNKLSLTFYSKKDFVCPVCEYEHLHEDLRRGDGRLISADLTDELHRIYDPSPKYGAVYPLIYPIYVCPSCYFAGFNQDFSNPLVPIDQLKNHRDARKKLLVNILPDVDFTDNRRLQEGLASYVLAIACYDFYQDDAFPVFKQGLCALRAGWLCVYLHRQMPDQQYLYLSKHFLRKATFLYDYSLELEIKKKQIIPATFFLGPDVDRNYGYDGVVYLHGMLEFRYGMRENSQKRLEKLSRIKMNIGKLFGFGGASREKPSAILDMARRLFDSVSNEVELLQVSQ